jgi:hypothetical protein
MLLIVGRGSHGDHFVERFCSSPPRVGAPQQHNNMNHGRPWIDPLLLYNLPVVRIKLEDLGKAGQQITALFYFLCFERVVTNTRRQTKAN